MAGWLTKSEEFNQVYERWRDINPDIALPECEECGASLVGASVFPGPYGWYCSGKCREIVAERMAGIPSDASERRAERRQMGITE